MTPPSTIASDDADDAADERGQARHQQHALVAGRTG